MDELLAKLVELSRTTGAVAFRKIEKEMILLSYPIENGILVAIGFDPDQARRINAELVVRKRSQYMERFGVWLPTRFNDGSWYLVRRILSKSPGGNVPAIALSEIIAAQELLM